MLKEFLVHLLADLTVLLRLNLLYLSIVYSVLVIINQILKSIVTNYKIGLIRCVLSLLDLLLRLYHCGR